MGGAPEISRCHRLFIQLLAQVDRVLGKAARVQSTFGLHTRQAYGLGNPQLAWRGAQDYRTLRRHFDKAPALAAAIVCQRNLADFLQVLLPSMPGKLPPPPAR